MLPPVFRTVKQPSGSKICAACMVAVATGHDLEVVEATMTKTPLPDGSYYYLTNECLAYLGRCGIHTGLTFQPLIDGKRIRIPSVDEAVLDLKWSMAGRQCMLVVQSLVYANAEHFVFWDGEHVRDSSSSNEVDAIGDYVIIEIMPLTYYDDTQEKTAQELIKLVPDESQDDGPSQDSCIECEAEAVGYSEGSPYCAAHYRSRK